MDPNLNNASNETDDKNLSYPGERKELSSDVVSNRILTIPNIISFFRLFLIPVFVITYLVIENYVLSIIVLAVSALSDVADGIIARKFKMTSEFGKLIDPVADKFTQGTIMICLTFKFPIMIVLIVAFIFREIVMIIMGSMLKKKTAHYSSAKWYGKVNTVIVEGSVLFLVVFGPFIPKPTVDIVAASLVGLSIASVFISLILYILYYLKIFREFSKQEAAFSKLSGDDPLSSDGPSDSAD
ncbi:MAG: CDP-alcohol phosphatidyltransferase family protein [Clostridia bacterium]|nr:CDP-alcohol phosphatidyltransferase family protein [Clostridia bacterium]